MRLKNTIPTLVLGLLFSAVVALGQVTAIRPYSVTVFATSVPGCYTKPDSIAVLNGHVFIGYGNDVSTTGSDGKSSTIVEYSMNGDVLKTFSVRGHNDGLRVNPKTHHLWAIQNEDANPTLVILDPVKGTQKTYTFASTHMVVVTMT